MKELLKAMQEKFGWDIGVIVYPDGSGHVFREDWTLEGKTKYKESIFMFNDISKLTLYDIEKA